MYRRFIISFFTSCPVTYILFIPKSSNFLTESSSFLKPLKALIHKCFLAKEKDEDFVLLGTGKPLRQFIYNIDLAKLIMFVLEKYEDIMNLVLPTLRAERRKTYCPFLPICPKTGKVLEIPLVTMDKKNGKVVFSHNGMTNWASPDNLDVWRTLAK